jgi:predicted GNAT superfamily acetyltransferase
MLFIYYLLFTLHISLFVDLSKLQQRKLSSLNYLIASSLGALAGMLLAFDGLSSFHVPEFVIGGFFSLIVTVVVTLNIERFDFLKIQTPSHQ